MINDNNNIFTKHEQSHRHVIRITVKYYQDIPRIPKFKETHHLGMVI